MAHSSKNKAKAPALAEVIAAIVEAKAEADISSLLPGLAPRERNIAKKIAAMKAELLSKSQKAEAVSDSLHGMNSDFQRAMQMLSAFTRFSSILSSCRDAAEVPHRVVKIFIDAFNFDQCSIMLYDRNADLLVHAAGAGQMDYFESLQGKQHPKDGLSLKPGTGAAGLAAKTMAPVVVNDVAADASFIKGGRGPTQGSAACLPMIVRERLVGVANFSHPLTGFFDEHILRALSPMVNAVGQIIEMARLQNELVGLNRTLENSVNEKTKDLEQANERLRNANRLKDDFIANINHELRTPLTSIIGFTRLLIDFQGMDPEERNSYLKIIAERGLSLEKLLNDLLDLSRMEGGNMPIHVERVNVGELVSRAVEQFRLMAEASGIAIAAHIDKRPLLLHADPRRLTQALGNLLHNAVKYTGQGGSIDVMVKELPKDIMVSVHDTGIGIDPSHHEIIFERFRQAENLRNKAGSAGIGLNLAKRIIELHGGRIWVESDPGQGSTFSFCIPIDIRCDISAPHQK